MNYWKAVLLALLLGIFSTVQAKPWVVLDSRNDMLAMSSEMTEDIATVQSIAVPPTTTIEPQQDKDEEPVTSVPDNISVTEPVQQQEDVKEVEQLVQKSESEDKIVPVDDNKDEGGIEQITTDAPVQSDQEEIMEVTTVISTPSVEPTGNLMGTDIKKEDVGVPVLPDPVRQNPNSVGDDGEPALIQAGKKVHEVVQGFLKKTKIFK